MTTRCVQNKMQQRYSNSSVEFYTDQFEMFFNETPSPRPQNGDRNGAKLGGFGPKHELICVCNIL